MKGLEAAVSLDNYLVRGASQPIKRPKRQRPSLVTPKAHSHPPTELMGEKWPRQGANNILGPGTCITIFRI